MKFVLGPVLAPPEGSVDTGGSGVDAQSKYLPNIVQNLKPSIQQLLPVVPT